MADTFDHQVNNTLDTLTDASVILSPHQPIGYITQIQRWDKVLTGVQPDGDALPFFVEKNDEKNITEEWLLMIRDLWHWEMMSCKMTACLAGKVLTLNVAKEGCSVSNTECAIECNEDPSSVRQSEVTHPMLQIEL